MQEIKDLMKIKDSRSFKDPLSYYGYVWDTTSSLRSIAQNIISYIYISYIYIYTYIYIQVKWVGRKSEL